MSMPTTVYPNSKYLVTVAVPIPPAAPVMITSLFSILWISVG